MKEIIWVGKCPINIENKLKSYNLFIINSIDECFNLIEKKYYFNCVYVITNENYCESFLSLLNNKVIYSVIIPLVFCEDIFITSEKLMKFEGTSYFPARICCDCDALIDYIRMDECNWKYNLCMKPKEYICSSKEAYGDVFIDSVSLKDIAFSYSLGKIIREKLDIPSQNIKQFQRFLITYYNESKNLIKPNQDKDYQISQNILALFYLRLYTNESGFYRNLNKDLSNNRFELYQTFIFLMYGLLRSNIISSFKSQKLYRCTMFSKSELDRIEDSLGKNQIPLYYNKTFFSFTKDKNIALNFLKRTNSNNLYNILFILDICDNNNYPVSNIDIGNISFFPNEKEVLFLPFSSFEIESIKNSSIKGSSLKIVNLRYWDKYSNKIEEFLNSKNEEEKTEFFANSINCLMAKDFIFNIDKNFKLAQNYAKYCGIGKNVLISSNKENNIIVQSYDTNQLNQKKNIKTFNPDISGSNKSTNFKENLNLMANTPITIYENNFSIFEVKEEKVLESEGASTIYFLNDGRLVMGFYTGKIKVFNKMNYNLDFEISELTSNIFCIIQLKNDLIVIGTANSLHVLLFQNKKYKIIQSSNEEFGAKKILEYEDSSFFSLGKVNCILWKKNFNGEYYKYQELFRLEHYNLTNAILTNFNEIFIIGYIGIFFLNIHSKKQDSIDFSGTWQENQNILRLKNNYILITSNEWTKPTFKGGFKIMFINTKTHEIVKQIGAPSEVHTFLQINENILMADNFQCELDEINFNLEFILQKKNMFNYAPFYLIKKGNNIISCKNEVKIMKIENIKISENNYFQNKKIIVPFINRDIHFADLDMIYSGKNIYNKPIIDIFENIILKDLALSSNFFDVRGNKAQKDWSLSKQKRGKRDYYPPNDYFGFGLNVLDIYNDNDWLGKNGNINEWAVAYHGTDYKNISNILLQYFIPGENQYAENEIDLQTSKKVGKGVYFSPKPHIAEKYSNDIKGYKFIIMCRVNPSKIRTCKKFQDEYILSGLPNEVRPYRLLIKKI